MQQVFVFNEIAIAVRHWFEIGSDDEEHGARLEVRRLVPGERRGSESAPQRLELDGIVWRADLFDKLGDHAGSYSRAHHHVNFDGIEPLDRAWDNELSTDPFRWTEQQLFDLPALLVARGIELRDPEAEVDDVRRALPKIMAAARGCAPTECASPQDCLWATRDAEETTKLMAAMFRGEDARDPRLERSEWSEWGPNR